MTGSDDPAARLRAEMVAHLTERGELPDPRIAAAFGQVPRHLFVPQVSLPEAYADQAVITRYRDGLATSSASQPAIVATMLEQLRPPPGGSVLEIGAGTGYNAALLSTLAGPSGRVVTVDIDRQVADEARDNLSRAGVTNVEVICGDGGSGWVDSAPYDGIIVTAGASDLAPAWVDQLAAEGRLVLTLSIRACSSAWPLPEPTATGAVSPSASAGSCPSSEPWPTPTNASRCTGTQVVYLHVTAEETEVDVGVVGTALDDPRTGARRTSGSTARVRGKCSGACGGGSPSTSRARLLSPTSGHP